MEKGEKFCNSGEIINITGDLLFPGSYEAALRGIDTILHMAAVTHTNNVSKYYEVNSNTTLKLLEAAKAHGVRRFIFISTRAISEKGGHYSRSKAIAEGYVRKSGMDWVILRLGEVYGIFSKTGVDMLIRNIKRFPFVPVVGNGQYRLAPIHISDIISSIIAVIEAKDKVNKVYNITGPEGFTYNELVDKISNLEGLSRVKVHIPLALVRILSKMCARIPKCDFLAEDQLPRLLCKKDEDISPAAKDINFHPARLEETIKS